MGPSRLNWATFPAWSGCILNRNQLSGVIPSQLGSLSNLEYLSLSVNELSGAIPPELGNLTILRWVYLSSNQLTGCVPAVWRTVANNDFTSLGLLFCNDSHAYYYHDHHLG